MKAKEYLREACGMLIREDTLDRWTMIAKDAQNRVRKARKTKRKKESGAQKRRRKYLDRMSKNA